MNKIVCIIRGGNVQKIYSSNEKTEIKIIDLDNEVLTDEEIKKEIENLNCVY
ncbi:MULTISPECIES: hypothetical protein [unclassified Clostridium]|uniref:hypothetical protein n=1 Tax=unclassified Clostridium TaxID=2614128 RepID=UPI0025BB995A|nr:MULTISPECIES: hypothetical protein [unclassified Clostridium]